MGNASLDQTPVGKGDPEMDSSSLTPNSLGSASLARKKRKTTDPLPWEKTDPLPSLVSPPSLSGPSSAPRSYLLKLIGNRSIRLPCPIVDKWQTTLGPVATNMAHRTEEACSLTPDMYFQSVVREGFYISWLGHPSLTVVVKGKPRRLPRAHEFVDPTGPQLVAFRAEHERMRAEGAVVRVRGQRDPPLPQDWNEHLCSIFAILQKDRHRAIFNMKLTNIQMRPCPFKMTGVAVLRSIIQPGDWLVSIDLKDAYLNIRIHSSQYKFQRYVFLETVWEIVTLPFGNAQAPYAFTRFVKALLKRWRARLGIRCLAWLDDIIAAHQCPRHLAWALQQMLDDLSYAGLKVNPKVGKSTLYPTQDLVWVGVRWLTLLAAIRIPSSRLHSVRKEVGAMIQLARRGKTVTAKEVCRLLGKIQSLAEALLPQRLYARPILRDLRQALHRCKDYSSKVFLSAESVSNLKWLHQNFFRWNGARWYPRPQPLTIHIITDASPYAWGAILRIRGCRDLHASGYFSLEEGRRWQNVREALGVEYAVQAFWLYLLHYAKTGTKLDPLQVTIKQDNASVVSYIRKMGGRKKEISVIVERTLKSGIDEHMQFLSEWIPGVEMPADAWSRELALHDTADWEVQPSMFRRITEQLGFFPQLDLFASRLNTKCKRFYSFRLDPDGEGWDALSPDKSWSGELAYAAPPPHLIPRVIQKVRQDRARILIFVPYWPLSLWWRSFLDALASPMLRIPLHDPTTPAVIVHRGADPRRWTGKMAIAALLGP